MNKKHFTLIELLVVIGIIAILSAILLPVLSGAAKKADMSKARSEISTLVNAIKQYESVYGVLPVPGVASRPAYSWKVGGNNEHKELDADAYKWLIKVLQAQNLTSTEEDNYGALNVVNSRKQKFLDIVGNDLGVYQDPWDNDYKVHFDSDYDGEIRPDDAPDGEETYIQGVGASILRFSVVVWSRGPDGKGNDTAAEKVNRDNIYSFPTLWTKNGHNISR